jgi:hypothetical protein
MASRCVITVILGTLGRRVCHIVRPLWGPLAENATNRNMARATLDVPRWDYAKYAQCAPANRSPSTVSAKVPLAPNSAAVVHNIVQYVHNNYGFWALNTDTYSSPIFTAGPHTPTQHPSTSCSTRYR